MFYIDSNKAFDNVGHCKLFSKLLDDNVNCVIVRLLDFWYSKQDVMFVGITLFLQVL